MILFGQHAYCSSIAPPSSRHPNVWPTIALSNLNPILSKLCPHCRKNARDVNAVLTFAVRVLRTPWSSSNPFCVFFKILCGGGPLAATLTLPVSFDTKNTQIYLNFASVYAEYTVDWHRGLAILFWNAVRLKSPIKRVHVFYGACKQKIRKK